MLQFAVYYKNIFSKLERFLNDVKGRWSFNVSRLVMFLLHRRLLKQLQLFNQIQIVSMSKSINLDDLSVGSDLARSGYFATPL